MVWKNNFFNHSISIADCLNDVAFVEGRIICFKPLKRKINSSHRFACVMCVYMLISLMNLKLQIKNLKMRSNEFLFL